MSVYQTIQKNKRQGRNTSEMARDLDLARNTVRKFLHMSATEYQRYVGRLAHRGMKFEPHRQEILRIYGQNDPREVRISSVYDVLEEVHGKLPGTLRTLTNYVKYLRESGTLVLQPNARPYASVEPLPYGKQMQMDFGTYKLAGAETAYIYAALLSASRARYVAVQDHPFCSRDAIQHTLDAFTYFGGRPEQLVFDQDRVLMVAENAGDILFTVEFRALLEEQELSTWVCRKADPESKGKIENTVKFVKTSFFSARSFATVADVHEPLRCWLRRRANGKICQATMRVPSVELETERVCLRPLRASIFQAEAAEVRDTRLVDSKGLISVRGNRYSVPTEYRGTTVDVFVGVRELVIFAHGAAEIARHPLSMLSGQVVTSKGHAAPASREPAKLYEALCSWDDDPGWGTLLARNRERYHRYWKEQYAGFKRLMPLVEDRQLLHQAIAFCLDCNTVSAANLSDTYLHLSAASQAEVPDALSRLAPILTPSSVHRAVVAKRAVGYYSSLVSMLGGAL